MFEGRATFGVSNFAEGRAIFGKPNSAEDRATFKTNIGSVIIIFDIRSKNQNGVACLHYIERAIKTRCAKWNRFSKKRHYGLACEKNPEIEIIIHYCIYT